MLALVKERKFERLRGGVRCLGIRRSIHKLFYISKKELLW